MPLVNSLGWLALVGGAVHLYGRAIGRDARREPGRWPIPVLLPYYLAAAAWAVKRRRYRYLLFSAAFPVAVLAGAGRRR